MPCLARQVRRRGPIQICPTPSYAPADLTGAAAAGWLHVLVAATYALDDFAAAHQAVEAVAATAASWSRSRDDSGRQAGAYEVEIL